MIDERIKKIIQDKDIALVGNAMSIFKKPRPIDEHEVVIRINLGCPKIYGKIRHRAVLLGDYIGKRTDILATSIAISEDVIKTQYDPKEILWCTPKHELMNDYLKRVAIKFPLETWQLLDDTLESRPSTGFMVFSYIYPFCKSITLYGFDFWRSANWYTENAHTGPHNKDAEETTIREMLKNKGKIIK